jgi:hypothetical protein
VDSRITILFLALVAVVLAIGWWRAHTRVRRGNVARLRIAQQGERDAEPLLAAYGYDVVDRQVTGWFTLWVDDEPVDVSARADLIVRGPDGTYVAEVKTGATNTDPGRPATRRQLLEYLHAFDVDGALLVDVPGRVVRKVSFEPPS